MTNRKLVVALIFVQLIVVLYAMAYLLYRSNLVEGSMDSDGAVYTMMVVDEGAGIEYVFYPLFRLDMCITDVHILVGNRETGYDGL